MCALCCDSLSIGVIFIAYAINIHYEPFLDRLDLDIPADSSAHVLKEGAVLNYVFQYNKLESIFLLCSITILLCGMIFESSFFLPGSAAYNFLMWMVRGGFAWSYRRVPKFWTYGSVCCACA